MFAALHNLRVDRATTIRQLNADAVIQSVPPAIARNRAAEIPALKAAVAVMKTIEFPGSAATIGSLERATQRLEAIHAESAAAFAQPKASRRANIAQDFHAITTEALDSLERASTQVLSSARSLSRESEVLQREVARFIETVKAA